MRKGRMWIRERSLSSRNKEKNRINENEKQDNGISVLTNVAEHFVS